MINKPERVLTVFRRDSDSPYRLTVVLTLQRPHTPDAVYDMLTVGEDIRLVHRIFYPFDRDKNSDLGTYIAWEQLTETDRDAIADFLSR